MESDIKVKTPFRQRALTEAKEILILTIYLYIAIGAMNVIKAAVLRSHGIDESYWGLAIVKALLLAKFVALGKAAKLGEYDTHRPLIWPTLRRTLVFVPLLIGLTIVEEVAKGLIHHQSVGDSLGELFGTRLAESLAGALLLLLVLIPFFALQILSDALGEGVLPRMFLVDRHAAKRS